MRMEWIVPQLERSGSVCVAVGQIWEDEYVSNREPWLVKVMKLNRKSARVEPCSARGEVAGYEFGYRMEYTHFDRGRMRLVKDTTTDEKIRPIITGTYGDTGMSRALVFHLAGAIDNFEDDGRGREHMIMQTCWTWFSGGDTAANAARKVEEVLDGAA